MIDEEKQAAFAGELSHFAVTLRMRQQELVISILDTTMLHKFHVTIGQPFIESQDKFFSSYFESPADVFAYLTQHFSDIAIEKGVLRFSYASGLKQQVREVAVELEKEQENESDLVQLRIAKVKEHYAAQLQQRDERIAALQQGLKEMGIELRQHKQEIRDRQKGNQEELERIEERLQREERNCKDLQERLHKAEETVAFMTSEHPKNEPEPEISHHPDNPHQKYYSLTNPAINSVKIERIGKTYAGQALYNFVNKKEVLPKQLKRYAIKIVKTTNNYLFLGFCTEKGLGNFDNFDNVESAYYFCLGQGYLNVEGVSGNLSSGGIVEGDVVECVADLKEGKLRWLKGGKVLAECRVPAGMKGKPIYLSILISSAGDSVEVSYVE